MTTPETGYVLIKRGLYWRPNGEGYTGILLNAGLYSDEESVRRIGDGVTRMRFTDAPEISKNTFNDYAASYWREEALRVRHLLEKAEKRIEKLEAMIDNAKMAFSETQPDEETRMRAMVAALREDEDD